MSKTDSKRNLGTCINISDKISETEDKGCRHSRQIVDKIKDEYEV